MLAIGEQATLWPIYAPTVLRGKVPTASFRYRMFNCTERLPLRFTELAYALIPSPGTTIAQSYEHLQSIDGYVELRYLSASSSQQKPVLRATGRQCSCKSKL